MKLFIFLSMVPSVMLLSVTPMLDAKAGAQYFKCISERGVPTTAAVMSSGKQVPMIRWVSDTFTDSGWSPERRCQEVSERFTRLNDQGMLRYMTTGIMNGMNVICTTLNRGDRCNSLLYTLKPGQNPTRTLKGLFNVRTYAVGPLIETGNRLYIDVNEYLGLGPSTSMPARSTGDKLNNW